ncbi:MAG TPA: DUF4349 domain-containing protein [Candidatus Cybelea sp.]|nr:DUF4349 domain-containing protein [Candidatus Cybelea sp.]
MAYLDGELGASEARSAAAHIAHCAECQAIAGDLWRISDRLLGFQIEPCPESVDRRILEQASRNHGSQIEEQTREIKAAPTGVPGWVVTSASISILAVLALLIIPKIRPNVLVPGETALSRQGAGQASLGRPMGEAPGIAPDSDGPFHGLGDHAANSFSTNGQPVSDQQAQALAGASAGLEPPMVVHTAAMTILASNYDQASGAVEPLVTQHGGYVQDTTANTPTGSARSMNATLRVPEKHLEPFLADLGKLGHVEQETRNNQEVTGPYVDLTARLRNARAAEVRILGLLRTKTGNLGEVLQAEQELARIRSDIESLDGQRATMEREVRYATVFLRLDEEYRQQLNPRAFTTGTRIRNAVVAGFQNLEDSLLAVSLFLFSYGLPALVWLALAGTLSWFFWRRLHRARES